MSRHRCSLRSSSPIFRIAPCDDRPLATVFCPGDLTIGCRRPDDPPRRPRFRRPAPPVGRVYNHKRRALRCRLWVLHGRRFPNLWTACQTTAERPRRDLLTFRQCYTFKSATALQSYWIRYIFSPFCRPILTDGIMTGIGRTSIRITPEASPSSNWFPAKSSPSTEKNTCKTNSCATLTGVSVLRFKPMISESHDGERSSDLAFRLTLRTLKAWPSYHPATA